MKTNKRWIRWIVAESAKPGITLPWSRTARAAARQSGTVAAGARQPARRIAARF